MAYATSTVEVVANHFIYLPLVLNDATP